MKRLALFAVLFIVACSEPLPEPPAQTATAIAAEATATVDAWIASYYATQVVPTPTPLPATATVLAAERLLNAEQFKLNVFNANRILDLTRTPLASPNPATVAAVLTASARSTAQADLYDKWGQGQIVIATITPVPLPTVTPTPAEVCALVDLNSASVEEIAALPANIDGDRLGTNRAQLINGYRSQNVIYFLDDLLGIGGIGPKTLAAIRESECTSQR